MIASSDRRIATEIIKEAIGMVARQYKACEALHISERTYNRWKKSDTYEDQRPLVERKSSSNKLSEDERRQIIDITTSEKYKNLPPSQIVPRLADEENRYIVSETTMYRGLKEHDMNIIVAEPQSLSKDRSQHIKQQLLIKYGRGT